MTAAKWQWLREHEPERAAAATGVRLPHDHLTERLSGTAVTDPGDASGTCWYGTATGAYDPEVLDLVGLDPALLPAVAPTGATRAGTLAPAAAEALGLPARSPSPPGPATTWPPPSGSASAARACSTTPSSASAPPARSSPPPAPAPPPRGSPASPPPTAAARTSRSAARSTAPSPSTGSPRSSAWTGRTPCPAPGLSSCRTSTANAPRPPARLRTRHRPPARHGPPGGPRRRLRGRCLHRPARPGRTPRRLRTRPGRTGRTGPSAAPGRGRRARPGLDRHRPQALRPPLVVPAAGELVALGAAALAAGAATGSDPVALAGAWGTGTGRTLPRCPATGRPGTGSPES